MKIWIKHKKKVKTELKRHEESILEIACSIQK